jgi:hypothetical protein
VSFAERVLRFTFSGAQSGSFSAAGLRAAANIQATDGKLGVTAQVKIWGLSIDQMNNYSSTISAGVGVDEFNLIIEAGDLGGQLSKVIDSPIWRSYIDLSGAPDSAFVVSVAGIFAAAKPNASQSWQGTKNAEDLISAVTAGTYTVINNGAHAVLQNPSVQADSILNQAQELASAAGFQLSWGIGNTLMIWPKNGTIDDVVIDIGPNTDPRMVGYPQFYQSGIIVTSLYNQEIQVGRQMNVVGSIITKANGKWSIVDVQHNLTTMLPKGPWFTTAMLAAPAT